MLELKNVNKKLGTKEVLKNINMTVNDGAVLGLVGINGAGKSTLLRCTAGVYRPDEGTILFDGTDTYLDEKIRRDIQFVADDPFLPENETIKRMLEFTGSFYDVDVERLHHYCQLLKLEENAPFSSFSKGMKRQAALLNALCSRPKLLLLDELFDGLDPLVRFVFRKIIAEMAGDGVTVVISSHNLKELEDICDSYVLLENGSVYAGGGLYDAKKQISKYQMAFETEHVEEDFKDFEILHYQSSGRVITAVIRGDQEQIRKALMEMNPLFLDVLNVSFEELFIYELEQGGHRYE